MFKCEHHAQFTGRVERVGWGQTRIRGRDTWPTYVPNAHFAQAAVTNMERITHRKFEAVIPLRFQVPIPSFCGVLLSVSWSRSILLHASVVRRTTKCYRRSSSGSGSGCASCPN